MSLRGRRGAARMMALVWAACTADHGAVATPHGGAHVNASAQQPPHLVAGWIELTPSKPVRVRGGPSEDVYMCTVIRLPQADVHPHTPAVRRVGWVWTRGNLAFIHHILLRRCSPSVAAFGHFGRPFPCAGDPRKEVHCPLTWHDGIATRFPAGYAQALDPYVLLEVHYRGRPASGFDMVDKSGIKLLLEPNMDGDAFRLVSQAHINDRALPPSVARTLPPGRERYQIRPVCRAECVACVLDRLRASALAVVSVNHHFHVVGYGASTDALHTDGRVERISAVRPNTLHVLGAPFLLRRGDAVRLTCVYNTTGWRTPIPLYESMRTRPARGQASEMCDGFLVVAPIIERGDGDSGAGSGVSSARLACTPPPPSGAGPAGTPHPHAADTLQAACGPTCGSGCETFARILPSCLPRQRTSSPLTR